MNSPTLFLVPVDFTQASISAIKFAVGLVQQPGDEVMLLHVVSDDRELMTEGVKLGLIADEYIPTNVKSSTKVVIGKVASTVGEVANATNASLIVLGTHGKSGISKLFNSYAFHIVEHSHTPFIIVQEETSFNAINRIILTIDTERESTQILRTAVSLGKLFGAEIILVAATQKDSTFKAKSDRNILICRNYLSEHGIKHRIEMVDGRHFIENIFKLSKELQVDMIAATYYQQHIHIFTDSFVRTLANNDLHIPLLTMEHETTHFGGQFGAMFG